MKKLLAFTLSCAMMFSVASCSGGSGNDTGSSGNSGDVWPKDAITVNVGAKAGGGTDIYTRLVTTPWQQELPVGVAVVNFDNAAVCYESTASAKPDGQTLLAMHTGIACQYITGGTDVNPLEDLVVVAAMQNMGNQALVVPVDAPYNNFTEMIDYAKANPEKVVAGIQTGGTSHFIFGLIEQETGATFKYVESQSETDKLTSVAGGFLDIVNVSIANAESYEADKKLKVIGLLTPDGKNMEGKPANWDAVQNQGYPNVGWGTSLYIFAPKGTDEATVEAINASLQKISDDADYISGSAKAGGIAEWHTVSESQKMFSDAFDKIKAVGENLGISTR